MAKTVEELLVYRRAEEMWDAVNAILQAPRLRQDLRLHGQLADASDSVVSNISEGFEQPTDRAFARYLFISKASAAEVRTRVTCAKKRGYVAAANCQRALELAEEVKKMCTGLARYLLESNRKDRGLARSLSTTRTSGVRALKNR
ncbi:MAG: four helix bundle protein [Acidobacteria bacterium]|nr:four helix bundle protein [Acidobacteriota bacterium]